MYGNIKGKEDNIFTSYNTDNIKYNNNFNKNRKNQKLNKENAKNDFENEIKSNSGTSISSNKEGYNNFVSKIKLDYNLKNPQGRTQTIILHTSLDKSISSDINNSLNESENNNIEQNDNIYNYQNQDLNPININSNPISNNYSQLNNGFMLDNSSLYSENFNPKTNTKDNFNDPNNMKNNKRNTVNYINSLYENEQEIGGNQNNNIQSEKGKKDNLTINFNNNMFFVGDNKNSKIGNNGTKNLPVNNIFNDFRPESEKSFNDKIFVSHNDFDNKYPGYVKNQKDNNILLPYGFQDNSFLNPNQINNKNDKNIYKNDFFSFEKEKEKNSNTFNYIPYNNNETSNMNNESTNLYTNNNNPNYNPNQNINNNNNISPFNTVQQSITSLPNFANSSNDLNNNNNNDGNNEKIIFDPYNNDADYNNNEENYMNPTSQFNAFPQDIPNNAVNAQNNQIYTDNFDDNNNNEIKDMNKDNNFIHKNSYNHLVNNLSKIPFNNKSNFDINYNNKYINNNDYNINEGIKVNNYKQEEFNSLRSSLDYSNNNGSIDEKSENKNNLLRSLLYGFLLGSTATGLFWLRNEKTKKYLWEKISKINFNSVIHLFKALLHPVEFLTKILSKEKREVYLKVLGVTLGKFYDFLEKYGDGFRLLGTFLFIYAIWLMIKSLIKASIKIWKDNN